MKTNQIILGGFIALSGMVHAQAVSFNTNNVPIGGANNAAFGLLVLTANTTGNHNTGLGNYSLLSNTSGVYNVGCGLNAMRFNTTGSYNTGIGGASVYQNTSGIHNIGIGVEALRNNTTGNRNTATGNSALYNSNADLNSAYGFETMFSNSSGTQNTGLGSRALYSNSTGNNNTSGGYQSMYSNTSGSENTTFGTQAFYTNTGNSGYLAVGYQALYNSNSAIGAYPNHAVGYQSLYSATSGLQNTAYGYKCLYALTTAHNNTGMGLLTLQSNSTGGDNTAVGCVALDDNTSGSHNTALGTLALDGNTTGSNNTGIGRGATVGAGNLNNATALGSGAIVNASNRVWLGNAITDVWAGIGAGYLIAPSDQRFKTDIREDDVKGIEFIKLLRPVVYNFDAKKFTEHLSKNIPDSTRRHYLEMDFSQATATRQTGFLAQEVESAAKKSGYNFNGVHVPQSDEDTYGLSYSAFVVPLVKAVQQQQQQIEKQDATMAAQQKQIEELKAMVQALAGNPAKVNAVAVPVTLSDKNTVVLNQNVPNPFAESTVIAYSIPHSFSKAQMVFSTADGRTVKTVDLTAAKGSLTVFAEDLSGGIYTYSLVVDGKTMDTKKMIKE